MTDSKQNDGDRDDPLQLLDQFMDFLKKNTTQFSMPSLEKINNDTGEIKNMGRRAQSLDSLKGPSPVRKRSPVSDRNNSTLPGRKALPGSDNDRPGVPDQRKAKSLAGNMASVPDRKGKADPVEDRETDSDGVSIPGLDFISSLIPEKMKVKITDIDDDLDLDRKGARSPAGSSVPIPDSKKMMSDVEEIERIADSLEKILNDGESESVEEPTKIIRPWDRFLFSMKRSIPPIFGTFAVIAYFVVVLRVLVGAEIPKLIQVVANPNHIFFGIIVILIITLIINAVRRYQIHLKVKKMQMSGKVPGGEAA